MGNIEVDAGLFEMILNSLANKQFCHEWTEEDRKDGQRVIDEMWNAGIKILVDYQQKARNKMELTDLQRLADLMTTLDERMEVRYHQRAGRIQMAQSSGHIEVGAKGWDISPERAIDLTEKLLARRKAKINYLKAQIMIVEETIEDAEGFIEELSGTPEDCTCPEDESRSVVPRCDHSACMEREGARWPYCDNEECKGRWASIDYEGNIVER